MTAAREGLLPASAEREVLPDATRRRSATEVLPVGDGHVSAGAEEAHEEGVETFCESVDVSHVAALGALLDRDAADDGDAAVALGESSWIPLAQLKGHHSGGRQRIGRPRLQDVVHLVGFGAPTVTFDDVPQGAIQLYHDATCDLGVLAVVPDRDRLVGALYEDRQLQLSGLF